MTARQFWLYIAFLIFALVIVPIVAGKYFAAHADTLTPTASTARSVSVSTSSVEILPVNKRRRYLLIENVCANNVGIALSGTTAALGTAGTMTLFPGGALEFYEPVVPKNAFNAIAATGSCGLTILEIE